MTQTDKTPIRPATAADAAEVRDCARRAYARYVAAIGREPAPMTADYAALIAAGEVHVAAGPDGLMGFVVFREDDGHMLLENVAVRPEAAGRGLGRRLIGRCEAAARDLGLPEIRLYTNARMADNLAIYPRLGYAETGRRHEDGFDRVFFAKRLG
ncbi:GNAT family N-acetyltransferase [Limimaricola pyoseonensis]|uniref:Predicted N-acetyltransferase YhbS n=1 Tax=Limimaricola pyoseonensis TaxID=521013 RepID=A0A1G7AVV4_9RHOB|nr:GNAT family N-acetyltransferase [Limimaricola pyoseonensis]SDE18911.1 Predicted N-acetyltransferase YhbS [Limimaricola pyoseonensis]